ncbi:DUF885 family protein [Metamycoplasma canadense]|uniref:p120' protein n=1 Tax=Metamycoplasma canadense TaxID=29554 RepID=A0A077L6B7_9BACT|nr:DUF885 family protein [Metamycoplasma canadense]BAP39502.1 P120' protein [Metamycoplasma canadense]
MNPKSKKALVISGIVSGLVLSPLALTLIPWGIQKTLVKKELVNKVNNLKTFLDNAIENAKSANKSKLDEITKKEAEIEKITNAEAKKKAIKELQTLKHEYNESIDSAKYPALEKLAQEGDSTVLKDSKKYTAEYVVLSYKKFKSELDNLRQTVDYYYPSKEDANKIVDFYQSWIDKFNRINKNNLDVVTTAWTSGLKYDWEIAKDVYQSDLRLVGAFLEWGTTHAYPINNRGLFKRITGEKAEKVQRNLKEGLESKIVLSKVVIKNNINSFLKDFYNNQLLEFAKSSESEKSVLDIIESNKTIDAKTKAFHKFYVSEYYNASKHGLGENISELKVYKNNELKELEDTIEVHDLKASKTYKFYGLGLTQKDLDAKNVGLGSISGLGKERNGNQIYSTILKFSTTSNDNSQEVFNSGYETSKTAAENMKKTAAAVAKLITGDEKSAWEPTIKYDEDGIGSKEASDITLKIRNDKGEINLSEFNKWLNQEKFFFGREDSTYYNDTIKKSLDEDTKLADARENLKNNGYEHLKNSDEKYGSITNKQFYYGALEAFKAYNQFRERTMNEGFTYFPKQVPKYGIGTYNFANRHVQGVGAYSGSSRVEKDAFGAFIFNPDPYYGLPKWSVTSFANHEGVMGHHNQIYYAQRFLKNIDGLTIGNVFRYTSYAEGWALFMEWFGIEAGYYGTPNYESDDYYAFPTSFKTARGITNFVKATEASKVTEEEIKGMKELHGGVYWDLVSSVKQITDEKEHTLKAVELTNMLQYFGALNEAQLRNMRRALDTAYHGEVNGKADLPANASINDIRKFMKENSALGIGDITSDSKRYLNYPGQATSYNSGKEAMLKLYDRVRKSKGLTRKEFVSNKENIKEFLNLLLETGALPLDTLKEIVELHYKLK